MLEQLRDGTIGGESNLNLTLKLEFQTELSARFPVIIPSILDLPVLNSPFSPKYTSLYTLTCHISPVSFAYFFFPYSFLSNPHYFRRWPDIY